MSVAGSMQKNEVRTNLGFPFRKKSRSVVPLAYDAISDLRFYHDGQHLSLAMSKGSPKKPSSESAHKTDVLTVFLTGNELEAFQPCGCSDG